MACAVLALVSVRNLFTSVVLLGIYSFLMATVLFALDAVDVAMTEAAVGAGISTVLLLGTLYLCKSEEAKPSARPWAVRVAPIASAAAVGALLLYGALDLPAFSDPQAPMHQHVAPRYLQNELEIPNAVTAVLASFRGYDTLGETVVVFTAGAGIIALLRRKKGQRKEDNEKHGQRANKERGA